MTLPYFQHIFHFRSPNFIIRLIVQNQMSSSVGTEEITPENEKSELISETTVSPVNKTGKSTKAGNKASKQAIDLWKENGFSR